MATGNFISYYRVSTNKQGINGLGIDAQKEIVSSYLNGGDWKLLDEFVEVESGKREDRPELQKAIKLCQLKNARLLVAKLDRLSRDLHFITSLQKAGIKFVVAENPDMNDLSVFILASIANHELKITSQRTQQALAQAKKRGVQLGSPIILRGERIPGSGDTTKARSVRKTLAFDYAQKMKEVIEDVESENCRSLREIAKELNARGFTTRMNKEWTANSVRLAVKRLEQ